MNFELNASPRPATPRPARRKPLDRPKPPAPRRWAALLVLFLALGFPLLAGPPAATAAKAADLSASVEESRDRVLGSGRFQTDRPEVEAPPDIDPPFRIPPEVVEAILWIAGIIVGAIVLYFLVQLLIEIAAGRGAFRLKRERRVAAPSVVETPVTLDRETRERTLAEADALAAAGRFSEAIHHLLLVAMDRLRRELGPRVAPALTSREVLKLAPIPGEVEAPLTRMVALSEIKHFGGRDASAPDYQSCRQDFVHFSGGEPARA